MCVCVGGGIVVIGTQIKVSEAVVTEKVCVCVWGGVLSS